jgi:L-alanine-DL-glutamate epimerase-like enolase superfamily enzyme
MIVRDVRVTVVVVPFTQPETWFFGRCWGLTNAILEVETDDGLIGLGEAPGHPNIDAVREMLKVVTPLIVGEDPANVARFLRRARMQGGHHFAHSMNIAIAAIEMALWDLVGKAAGAPIHRLWGGLEQTHVPYYWYIPVPDRDAPTARRQAAEGVERGFATMYLKIGFDVAADVALVTAVREEVGPDIHIRVDANEAWSAFDAIDALRAFEDVRLEFLEQPIDMHDFAGAAALRDRTRTKIGANQSAWELHEVAALLAARATDAIVTDPHQLGGLARFRDAAAMCEVARVPLIKHSFADLGITTAATLHVLGALHAPVLAHQTHLTILEHDLLTTPFKFVDGNLEVPTGPGLGVELDREALRHYAELYETVGEPQGYGALDRESTIPPALTKDSVASSLA